MAFVTLFICIPACLLSIGIVNITIRLLILHQMQYIYIYIYIFFFFSFALWKLFKQLFVNFHYL